MKTINKWITKWKTLTHKKKAIASGGLFFTILFTIVALSGGFVNMLYVIFVFVMVALLYKTIYELFEINPYE